uniref:Non-structural maintenance of chromosomes element 1 homolog n=1 Tax=Aegilops tauschii TaxID=37682 RepID=M8CQQ3_AEGTA
MAPLSWRHHTLLQALLSRGPLSERDFHALFTAISGGKNPATHQQLFSDTLMKINNELGYLQFDLRACINQYDGTVYYGVVNNISDEESKLGSKYSVPQIAFYKGLLEAIVHEAGNDGSITSIEALHVRIDNQEKTLTELIQDRWLAYTSEGKIGLGIRSFLDLRSWFRSNDIPSCEVCNEAGIKASTCSKEGCNVRIHIYCLKKKFPQRKASRACPQCATEWPQQEGEDEGDEEANEPGGEGQEGPSADPPSRRKRRVKAELAEEAEEAGPSTAVPRRSSRMAKAEEAAAADASQPARSSKRRKK